MKKRHSDVLIALSFMKEEEEYKNTIRNMGMHPFFYIIIVVNRFISTGITAKLLHIQN